MTINTVIDQRLLDFLAARQVEVRVLDVQETVNVEHRWREIYGHAFAGRPRLRQGVKAESAYEDVTCLQYWIIPFSSKLLGTAVQPYGPRRVGYECRGRLVPLSCFHTIEFFVSPDDFHWTMVHTHEDHGFGGPYFLDRDWIPSIGNGA